MKKLLLQAFIFLLMLIGLTGKVFALSIEDGCQKLEYFQNKSSDINFGELGSGLDIALQGRTVYGWLDFWCVLVPNGEPFSGNIFFPASKLNAQITLTANNANQGDAIALYEPVSKSKLPVTFCFGDAAVANAQVCLSSFGTSEDVNLNSIQQSKDFANALTKEEVDNSGNPINNNPDKNKFNFFWDVKYRGRSFIKIAPNPNLTLAAGDYSLTVNLTINGQLRTPNFQVSSILTLPAQDVDVKNIMATVTLRAHITKDCKIKQQPQDIKFDGLLRPSDFTANKFGSFKIQCTKDTPFSVKFTGSNDINNSNVHYMVSGKSSQDKIGYKFYDETGQREWDNTYSLASDGTVQTIKYQAGIIAGQSDLPVGSYSDTVYIEITY